MTNSQPSTSIFNERDYFTYPAVFSALASSVKTHDPALFIQCAKAIDTGHVFTLRGLGYLGKLVADDSNATDMQRSIASETIAEITAFVATLLEMQNEAEFMQTVSK